MIFMIGELNFHYKKGIGSSHVIINQGLKECGLKIHTSAVQLLVHIWRSRRWTRVNHWRSIEITTRCQNYSYLPDDRIECSVYLINGYAATDIKVAWTLSGLLYGTGEDWVLMLVCQKATANGYADRQRENAQVENQQGRKYRCSTQLRTKS